MSLREEEDDAKDGSKGNSNAGMERNCSRLERMMLGPVKPTVAMLW